MVTFSTRELDKKIDEFEKAIALAWSDETTTNAQRWLENQTTPVTDCPVHAAIDQCAVTAVLAQKKLGGEIIRVMCTDENRPGEAPTKDSHYFNILPDGRIKDFTKGQFSPAARFAPSNTEPPYTVTLEELYQKTAEEYAALTPEQKESLKTGHLYDTPGELPEWMQATRDYLQKTKKFMGSMEDYNFSISKTVERYEILAANYEKAVRQLESGPAGKSA